MDMQNDNVEARIAARLKVLRSERGLTLDDLASLSGVSRAMISRIERADASPTASLLARLCSALGLSLSAFFEAGADSASPLARRAAQPLWRDPESGYLRRSVSPPVTGSGVDIVEVEFPPGARVVFADQPASRNMFQHVWLFAGTLEMQVGENIVTLEAGDCLWMSIGDVHSFHNPGPSAARYAVIIETSKR